MKCIGSRTVLVTGGAGYVGSHISLLLAQQGYCVIILDALRHGQSWTHPWATFIEGDVGDTACLQQIFQTYAIDTVIHCAASIEVSQSLTMPIQYYLNNVAVTLNLLQLMVHYTIPHLIFSSTCALYGTPQVVPIPEDHPLNPLSPYGTSKMMVEQIIQDSARAHGFSYAILRYFNAAGALAEYGLGEYHVPETHVIPRLLHAALTRTPFMLNGIDYQTFDGSVVRDYTHVADIARAHILAMEYVCKGGRSEICNLGTGKGTSIKQLIATVEELLDISLRIIPAPRRQGDAPMLIADSRKAALLLGWELQQSDIKVMVQSTYSFMKKMPMHANIFAQQTAYAETEKNLT